MTCIIQVNSTKYDMSKLPQMLRMLRAKSGLRNFEIAEQMGLSAGTISGHMSDAQAHKPDLETLIKYSKVFDVPLEKFIEALHEEEKIPQSLEKELKVAEMKSEYEISSGDSEKFIQKVVNYVRSLKSDRERMDFFRMLLDKAYKDKQIGSKGENHEEIPETKTNTDR